MENMYISLLYPEAPEQPLQEYEPACFKDLNLDQIFRPMLRDDRQGLSSFYYTLPSSRDVSSYRHAVMRDLLDPRIRNALLAYQKKAEETVLYSNAVLHEKMSCYECGQLLYISELYIRASEELDAALAEKEPSSEGIRRVHTYIRKTLASAYIQEMKRDCRAMRDLFSPLRYTMMIRRGEIKVIRNASTKRETEPLIKSLFARFADAGEQTHVERPDDLPVSSADEERLLEVLAKLFPDEFRSLRQFAEKYRSFDNSVMRRIASEILFYTNWLKRTEELEERGLCMCVPELSAGNSENVTGCYDLALALSSDRDIVPNHYDLRNDERLMVISGPNNGGKTTFARCCGQIHYLACLGLTVPASSASVRFVSKVLTHFETEDAVGSGSGRLKDDLERLKKMLDQTDENTLTVINEIFTSTTYSDALQLGEDMIRRLLAKNATGVIVTFLDALASLGSGIVSMMSTVSEDSEHRRLYRIVRMDQTGEAYALQLAGAHGLLKEQIIRRISHAS